MSNLTKQAIQSSMLKLLHEKPVCKITVKDIVEDCGINRNTFYYHYQDIPSLIEAIFTAEADRIIETYKTVSSFEECLDIIADFAVSKTVLQNLYRTPHRELYEQCLWRTCEYVVSSFMNTIFEHDTSISDKDKSMLIQYYKCTMFGLVMDWLNHDMKTDIRAPFRHLSEMQNIVAERILNQANF